MSSVLTWLDMRRVTGLGMIGAVLLMNSTIVLAENLEIRALNNRLQKLEREVLDIQREAFRDKPGEARSGYGPDPSSQADLSLRLQDMESYLRALNGRLETVEFGLRRLETDFRAYAADGLARPPGGETPVNAETENLSPSGAEEKTGTVPVAAQVPGGAPAGMTASPRPLPAGVLGSVPRTLLEEQEKNRVSKEEIPPDASPDISGVLAAKTPDEAYQLVFSVLQRGQFDKAESGFLKFLELYPAHSLAGNAQYWLGETYYVQGKYKPAADAFLKGYRKYASSNKAPDSLLKLGMTLAALGESKAACTTLGELSRRFPSAAPQVRQRARLEQQRTGC